ncbi:glutamate receptor subunit 1 [Nephila pilipes]|uniref:Glutamate receptor subunit 1 n=1 Tax=Nephila pilipes TaxID=299642 RepID=A0A8X6PI99_NEPPI|nr:glutamate receptor subunit 1 [Nephila pilipes]
MLKKKIIVGVLTEPHIFEIQETENGHLELSGFEAKYLEEILTALDVEYEFSIPTDGEFGLKKSNGNWTGLIGMIQREEADMTLGFLSITDQRLEVVDFTKSYMVYGSTFVIENPGYVHPYISYLYPFNVTTWIYIICTTIIVSILFCTINQIAINREFSSVRIFCMVFGSLVKQPLILNKELQKWRWFISFWLTFVTLISLGYSACLQSFLTLPFPKDTIRTFRQISSAVQRGTHRVFTLKGSLLSEYLAESEEAYLRIIGEEIIRNNWLYPFSESGSAKYISENSIELDYRISNEFFYGSHRSDKRFITSLEEIAVYPVGFAVRKHFYYSDKINTIISRFACAGIYEKLIKDSSVKFRLSESKDISEAIDIGQISMKHLAGVFSVLFRGIAFSFVLLILEIFCYKITHNTNYVYIKSLQRLNLK